MDLAEMMIDDVLDREPIEASDGPRVLCSPSEVRSLGDMVLQRGIDNDNAHHFRALGVVYASKEEITVPRSMFDELKTFL